MKKRFIVVIGTICILLNMNAQNASSNEPYRPAYHFTPAAHWMNDPNGLVYYAGEYHLFYQYYPEAAVWGPMHWGHAVSTDLFHWKHLPIALYPDSLGYIFSGSAVIDYNNTSGLGSKTNPAMIAVFAYHNPKLEQARQSDFQYQGLAYSVDKGRTWKKYTHNPVIPNPGNLKDFRDPKVIWDSESGKWIVAIAAGDEIQFYSSSNLLQWQKEGAFGKKSGAHSGVWECPDLFQMQVKGSKEPKWVLLISVGAGGPNGGSATQYFTGNFDGHQFSADSQQTRWLDYGKDNYAGVTWSNIPPQDGRRLFIGWMSNWQYATQVPTEKWRSAMTAPRELTLIKNGEEYILCSNPAREIGTIRQQHVQIRALSIDGEKEIGSQIPFQFNKSEIVLTFKIGNPACKQFGIKLSNNLHEELVCGYDCRSGHLFVDRSKSGNIAFSKDFASDITAPCPLDNNTLKLHILLDEASAEIFAQQGKTVLTNIFFPTRPYDKLSFFSKGGTVQAADIRIDKLASSM